MKNQNYDFIIVGAGSSGCVIAKRLSDAGYNTLLVEAGGKDNSPYIHIPMGYGKLFKNKKINWCYYGEPEPYLNNRKSYQPRGKVLGGTGSINGMLYVRGQAEDYDNWKSEGCVGWGYEDVLPYFKKSQHQVRGENKYHGVGGPLWVSDLPSRDELADAFIKASHNLGSPLNNDFNGETQEGTGYYQVTTKKNKRWSTARAFLGDYKNNKNLTVLTKTLAKKIIVEEKKAKGIIVSTKNGDQKIFSNFEVILSGGTINSPQLLMLSGIGDGKHLKENQIEVVYNSPEVGKNLQDHFGVATEYRCNKPITVNDLYHSNYRKFIAAIKYLFFKQGPFASNGNYANTFIKTNSKVLTPDMMVTYMGWCTGEDLGVPKPFSAFTILAEHSRPDSRGFIKIKSNKAEEHPVIQFNFFESKHDRDAIIKGVKFARLISQTDPIKAYVKEEISPGLNVQSYEELENYCQNVGGSLLHCVGTCRMGKDHNSVVDLSLKVRGVDNLRVIDASIMPRIVSGNTQAAAIMIGEKGSDLILESYR